MDRIERVARAMCEADGHKANETYESGGYETVKSGMSTTRQPKKDPLWTKYEAEARRFVAAHDALAGRGD
jgi:hypothetical protein